MCGRDLFLVEKIVSNMLETTVNLPDLLSEEGAELIGQLIITLACREGGYTTSVETTSVEKSVSQFEELLLIFGISKKQLHVVIRLCRFHDVVDFLLLFLIEQSISFKV